ncbi:hypothetical protein ABTL86_16155, partial [Acinetobacter baumannii]
RLKSYCHTAGNLNRIKIGMGFSGRLLRYYLAMSIIKIISKIKADEINSNKDLITFLDNQKFG